MKNNNSKCHRAWYIGAFLLAAVLSAGCSASEEPAGNTDNCAFSVTVKARSSELAAATPDDANQYTRLYVAQRLQEHDLWTDPLHCAETDRHTVAGGTYTLENLFGQWYKFAFVCVPAWENGGGAMLLTEENPAQRTCDFNRLLIDYNDAMMFQQSNVNIAAGRDMNVYRKVIDRWIDPDNMNQEDVVMTRITGELVIDMGIPADQFPKPLKSIRLSLHEPVARAYIHDEAADNVIAAPEAAPADRIYTLDFSSMTDVEYAAAMKQKQRFRICLLPQTLRGGITISFKGTGEAIYLPFGDDADNGEISIEVRKNRITNVLYNGMEKNEFEVRYAGFDVGDDAVVDADDDTWDGWQDL